MELITIGLVAITVAAISSFIGFLIDGPTVSCKVCYKYSGYCDCTFKEE